MFGRKKDHTCSRPVVRHSQLLALEPRQVFDAAVGAAIAEVLAPANEPADTPEPAEAAVREHSGADSPDSGHSGPAELQRRGPGALLRGGPDDNTPPVFLPPSGASADRNTPFSLGNLEVQDRDGDHLTLTLTIVGDTGRFHLGNDAGTATLTLDGYADAINNKLSQYVFKPTGNREGTAEIRYVLKDGHDGGVSENRFSIDLRQINTPPTVTGDSSFEAFIGKPISAGSSGNITGLTVNDDPGDTLTVTITAMADKPDKAPGFFRVTPRYGVTVGGDGQAALTLTGQRDNINALLGSLRYTAPDHIGRITLSVEVTDGEATAKLPDQTIIVNDAPSISVAPDFTGVIPEFAYHDSVPQKPLVLGPGLTIEDRNGGDLLTLEVDLINAGELGQLYLDIDDQTKEAKGQSYSLIKVTQSEINAALAKLSFQGAKNRSGDASFKVKVTDSLGAVAEFQRGISVTPVNDHPEVNDPGKAESATWLNVFEDNRNPADGAPGFKNTLTLDHLGLGGDFDEKNGGGGISDPDTPAGQVMITLKTTPQEGELKKAGQLLGVGAAFSLDDVRQGLITYEHSGAEVPVNGKLDGFTFTVDDGSDKPLTGTFRVNIKLNPYNDDFSIISKNAVEEIDGRKHLTVWAWERQSDAGLAAVKLIDVMPEGGLQLLAGDDKAENIAITFDTLPVSGAGTLYVLLKDGRKDLAAGDTISGADLKNLYFAATDEEPGKFTDQQRGFTMTFADRWGNIDRTNAFFDVSDTLDRPNTKEVHVLINIAPNNDDPVLVENRLGSKEAPQTIRHDVNPGREVRITSDHLQVKDVDSAPENITFTLKDITNLEKYGVLYLEGVNGGNSLVLGEGACFTMKDVASNRLYFQYWSNGGVEGREEPGHFDSDPSHLIYDIVPSFTFTVQDGGVTSWLEKGSTDDTTYRGDESYHTSHEGGIYDGQPYQPYAPSAALPLKEHTFEMYLSVCLKPGDFDPQYDEPDKPVVTVDNSRAPLIYEGHAGSDGDGKPSSFTLTGGYFKNGAYDPAQAMILIKDSDTPPDQLVLSLLNSPKGGHLTVDGNRIFVGDSFTLKQLMDEKVRYVHESDECFNDQLKFAVSDGTYYVKKTGDGNGTAADIALDVDIIPYNDAPRLDIGDQSLLVVNEGGELKITGKNGYYNPAEPPSETPAPGSGVVIKYYDPDNNYVIGGDPEYLKDSSTAAPRPDPNRPDGSFTRDPLKFNITRLPEKGDLYYRGDMITPDNMGTTFIPAADLDSGELKYIHRGGEDKQDSFTIRLNDNSTEAGGEKDAERMVTLVVRAVNDAPVLTTGQDHRTATVTESDEEAGRVTIYGKDGPSGQPSLIAKDDDNDPSQIIYRITRSCSSGTLYRDGVPLGEGSCFTQADLDAELISYQHSGKNQHKDSFQFVVTDNSLYYNSDPAGSSTPWEILEFSFTANPVNEAPSFTGMDRLEIYYKDQSQALQIFDADAAADVKKYIMVDDPDQSPNRGYIEDPEKSSLNDYMELTITAMEKDTETILPNGKLSISSPPATGLTIVGTDSHTLVLKGSREAINTALKTLMFQITKIGADEGGTDLDDTVRLHFNLNDCNNGLEPNDDDGEVDHTSASRKHQEVSRDVIIHVSTYNDDPATAVAPPANEVQIQEDTYGYIFNRDGLHQLSFTDVDAFDSTDNKLEISAGQGTISYNGPSAGLTGASGNGSGKLILTGALEALNKALEHVRYRGGPDFNGEDAVTVTYTDGGPLNPNSAEAGKSTTPPPFKVCVIPVNDRPTVKLEDFESHLDQMAHGEPRPTVIMTRDNHQTGTDDYRIDLGGKINIGDKSDFGQTTGLSIDENDPVEVTVSAVRLYYETAPGVGSFSVDENLPVAVDDDDPSKIILTGTWNEVRTALNSLAYTLTGTDIRDKDVERVYITVEVNDRHNGETFTPNTGNNKASASFLVNVNIDDNEAPTISGGDLVPDTYEDLYLDSRPDHGNRFKLSEIFKTDPVSVGDGDSYDEKLLFKVEITKGLGTLWLNGQEFKPGDYYADKSANEGAWNKAGATLSEIRTILSRLEVELAKDFNGDLALTLTVNDKGHTGTLPDGPLPDGVTKANGGLETQKTLHINVHPVNDAPVASDGNRFGGTATMDDIEEDIEDSRNSGEDVATLFKDFFSDPKDPQGQTGSFTGVLVVGDASTEAQGRWQYYNGTKWVSISGVKEDNALYLDKGVFLRFQPKLNYAGKPGQLTVRLVENTDVSVPSDKSDTPNYTPFFGQHGQSLTGQTLATGNSFDLTMGTGDFKSVGTAFRPYTENTVKLAINVTGVNDTPAIAVKPNYTMDEDGTPLHLTGLTIKDPDIGTGDPAKGNSYTLTITASGPGRLEIDPDYAGVRADWNDQTRTLTISGDTFAHMKALVEGDGIIFTPKANHHSGEDGAAKVKISFTLSDGGQSGEATATVTITPVNDAPWVGSGNRDGAEAVHPPFTSLNKDAPDTDLPAAAIDDLFEAYYYDGQDADVTGSPRKQHTFAGVALEYDSPSSRAGTWQYTADGVIWKDLPALSNVSNDDGFFLSPNAQLRFKPNGTEEADAPTLHAHLLDDSRNQLGEASGIITLTGRTGGTGDVSEKTVALKASTITDQRPHWNSGTPGKISLPEIAEDPLVNDGLTVSEILAGQQGDPGGNGPAGLLVTGAGNTDGQGLWEYSTDGGDHWKPVKPGPGQGVFLDLDAKIRFTPAPNYNGPVSGRLTVKLADGDTGLNGPGLPASGGQTSLAEIDSWGHKSRYSTGSRELAMTVTPVNDAPAAAGNANLPDQSVPAGGASDPFTVGDLFKNIFSDAKDRIPGGPGNALNGVFVTGSQADPLTEGLWEYFDGVGWQPVQPGDYGDANALYLGNADQIRFKPAPGFSGRPGRLDVRLAETDDRGPAYTGVDRALPAGLTAGGTYDLGPSLSPDGHISGPVGLNLNLAVPEADNGTPYHRPPQEKELDPDLGSHQNGYLWARQAREWKSPQFPVFERLGLDDPHVRTSGATDGIGQEVPLIVETHIINVNRFTTNHINRSVGQAHQTILQAADGLAISPADYVDSALNDLLKSMALGSLDGEEAPPRPPAEEPEGSAGREAEDDDADREVFLRKALDDFSALLAADDDSPAGEDGPAPPGDRDLDSKMQTCSIASLLAESRAFLISLLS